MVLFMYNIFMHKLKYNYFCKVNISQPFKITCFYVSYVMTAWSDKYNSKQEIQEKRTCF